MKELEIRILMQKLPDRVENAIILPELNYTKEAIALTHKMSLAAADLFRQLLKDNPEPPPHGN